MYCNESYLPDLPSTRQTVSWLYDVIIIPNMHLNNFNNNSDITAEVTLSDGEDDDDVLVTDASFDKMIYVKVLTVAFIVVLSLVGNLLVILSVAANKAMRTTMNYYLVNLSIADLMITVWCPVHTLVKELSPRDQYLLPAVFCKIAVFYTVLCMISSILTLSAISCDRFLAVCCPLRTRVTQRKARYFIVFVWVVAATVASPFLIYRKIVQLKAEGDESTIIQQSCSDVFPTFNTCDLEKNKVYQAQTAKKIYYSFVNIVMFFIPILLMTICYSMIVAKLYCSSSPGERLGGVTPQARAKRKVVKLVLVVITTFVICWSPHQVPMAHAIFNTGSQLPDWLMENEFWINMIAYSHAMINPIIYITFNENFKKSFKRLMCCTDDEITYEYSNPSFHRQFSWKRSFRKKSENLVNFQDIELRCLQENQFVHQLVQQNHNSKGEKSLSEGPYKTISFNGVKKF